MNSKQLRLEIAYRLTILDKDVDNKTKIDTEKYFNIILRDLNQKVINKYEIQQINDNTLYFNGVVNANGTKKIQNALIGSELIEDIINNILVKENIQYDLKRIL